MWSMALVKKDRQDGRIKNSLSCFEWKLEIFGFTMYCVVLHWGKPTTLWHDIPNLTGTIMVMHAPLVLTLCCAGGDYVVLGGRIRPRMGRGWATTAHLRLTQSCSQWRHRKFFLLPIFKCLKSWGCRCLPWGTKPQADRFSGSCQITVSSACPELACFSYKFLKMWLHISFKPIAALPGKVMITAFISHLFDVSSFKKKYKREMGSSKHLCYFSTAASGHHLVWRRQRVLCFTCHCILKSNVWMWAYMVNCLATVAIYLAGF